MGAAEAWGASLTGRETPEQISGLHLSEDMFPLLGVAPIRGRTFDANDFGPGKDQVAVIGYALWQRSFGGSDSAIGQKILLDGENYTVIGVMPPDFYFAPFWVTTAEIWAPLDLWKMFSGPAGAQAGPEARPLFAARLRPPRPWHGPNHGSVRDRPDLSEPGGGVSGYERRHALDRRIAQRKSGGTRKSRHWSCC